MTDEQLERLADLVADKVAEKIAANMPKPARDVMTTIEAANYLNCSKQQLEILRHTGGGPPFVKWSRAVRYRKIDLDEYIQRHLVKNTAERGAA